VLSFCLALATPHVPARDHAQAFLFSTAPERPARPVAPLAKPRLLSPTCSSRPLCPFFASFFFLTFFFFFSSFFLSRGWAVALRGLILLFFCPPLFWPHLLRSPSFRSCFGLWFIFSFREMPLLFFFAPPTLPFFCLVLSPPLHPFI